MTTSADDRGAKAENITISTSTRPAAVQAPGSSSRRSVHPADDDLWVATVDGEYAGLITRRPDGFQVHDRFSRPIAMADTLAHATALLPWSPPTCLRPIRRRDHGAAPAARPYQRKKAPWPPEL